MIKTKTFWIGVSLIWIAHFLMDFMLGVWPVYKTIFHIDLVVAGWIASLSLFLGEGFQLYFGYLSDKGYAKGLLALGLGLTATIPFLSYLENEWLLFAMVLCAYIGSGAFHPSGTGIITASESSHQSFFVALFACGGMVGAAFSQIGYTYFYNHFPNQIWILFLPVVICTLLCAFFSFPKKAPQKKQRNFKEILKSLAPQKNKLILLYVVHVLLQIVVLSFAFLLSDILVIKNYENWFCLGGGYFCFILGSVITSLPLGYCVDKFGYRLVLAAIIVASASFLYLFLSLESLTLTLPIVLLFLLGGTMGVIVPVVVAGGIQDIPSHARSFVSALYMGGTTCLAGFGPILASFLASFFGYHGPVIALQGLNFLLVISLVIIYYLPDSTPEFKPIPQLAMASSKNGDQR